jgi:hypothetical protein
MAKQRRNTRHCKRRRGIERPRRVRSVVVGGAAILAAAAFAGGCSQGRAQDVVARGTGVHAPDPAAPGQPTWLVRVGSQASHAAVAGQTETPPPVPTAGPIDSRGQRFIATALKELPSGTIVTSSTSQQFPDVVVDNVVFATPAGQQVSFSWQQLPHAIEFLPPAGTSNESALGTYSKDAGGESVVLNGRRRAYFVTPGGLMVSADEDGSATAPMAAPGSVASPLPSPLTLAKGAAQ